MSYRTSAYAVLRNTRDIIEGYIANSSYERPTTKLRAFTKRCARSSQTSDSKVVLGVYRTSYFESGSCFYAHEDHVHEAAQDRHGRQRAAGTRGFPDLIDIADRIAAGMFDPGGLAAQVHAVLRRNGSPFRFFDERCTPRLMRKDQDLK